jgi:hypothetical protein
MHERVVAARDALIEPWARHVAAIDGVYDEASGARRGADPLP